MIAIKCGYLAIVKVIVQQAPIALHIVDGQGNALCVAVAYGHLPIVKWLVTHTDVSLWYFSARSGSPLLLAFGRTCPNRTLLFRVAHQRGQLAKMLDVSMMLTNGHDGLKAYTLCQCLHIVGLDHFQDTQQILRLRSIYAAYNYVLTLQQATSALGAVDILAQLLVTQHRQQTRSQGPNLF